VPNSPWIVCRGRVPNFRFSFRLPLLCALEIPSGQSIL
jgi:hypothetical protein